MEVPSSVEAASPMSDVFGCEENPYASPNDPCPPGIDPYGRLEPIRVAADWLDAVLYLSRVALFWGALVALLFFVTALLMSPLSQARAALGLLWMVILLQPVLLPVLRWLDRISSLEVTSLSVDDEGLHFHRRRLPPDDWSWQSIAAIRLASRWEVAWYGWFRPLLKRRERTKCNSALGHYRIQGKTDYCFYPPKNPEAFVEAVARYRPDLLQPPQQNPQ